MNIHYTFKRLIHQGLIIEATVYIYFSNRLQISLTRPRGDRNFHKALMARTAVFSKMGSPVRRLRAPNSSKKVPTPAVHVTVVSPLGTPCLRLTVPYGIPVGVSNADEKEYRCLYLKSSLSMEYISALSKWNISVICLKLLLSNGLLH